MSFNSFPDLCKITGIFFRLSPEAGPEAFEKRDFGQVDLSPFDRLRSRHIFYAVADEINDCVACLAFKEHKHCRCPGPVAEIDVIGRGLS